MDHVLLRSLDMRYEKQFHMLNIPIGNGEFDLTVLRQAGRSFNQKHEQLYGFRDEMLKIKIVNARLTSIGKLEQPVMKKYKRDAKDAETARKGTRGVIGLDMSAVIYDRKNLSPGTRLKGPAILEASDTTVWIPSNHSGEVDDYKNVIIRKIWKER